jgi:hypothetical protein
VVTVENLKNRSSDLLQHWMAVKNFCLAVAIALVLVAFRIQLSVPWWYAVFSWLLVMNVIIIGIAMVLWIEEHFDILFPGARQLRLP